MFIGKMVWAVAVGVLVLSVRGSSQEITTSSPPTLYWWLELKTTPFGGRNYNSEEIQRGEHIRSKNQGKGGKTESVGEREVKMINKREADNDYYDDYSSRQEFDDDVEEGGVIALNEIDTECPAGSSCVETFYCGEFSGKSDRDKIPCLLTRGKFAGDFGICCTKARPRVCPKLRIRPEPESCLPRPLGDPEDEECPLFGIQSSCPEGSLCCFNGCINVCLEDPPRSVDTAFWLRRPPVEVGREQVEDPLEEEDQDYFSGSGSGDEYEFDGSGVGEDEELIEDFSEKLVSDRENRSEFDNVVLRLLQRLRSRIS